MKRIFCLLLSLVTALALFSACGGKNDETTAPEEIAEAPKYTEGLIYVENGMGGCLVSGYKGSDTDIVIPDVYGGMQVTAIANSAFAGNLGITSVTIGANVKEIEAAAFVGCENLAEANLDGALENIGVAAFFGCKGLKSISLPSGLKRVEHEAFAFCPAIESISYNGNQSMWSRVSVAPNNEVFDTKLVLADGGAMIKLIDKGECNANISWRLGYDEILYITGNGHIPNYAFDKVPWGKYADSISSIVVEDGIDIIGKNAFLGCYNATSVTIAESVRLIEESAFYGCKALEEITLPQNLRRIGDSAFFGCSSLKAISIPDAVKTLGSGVFMGCSALADVKLSSGILDVEEWCFANCTSLQSIDLTGVWTVGTNAFFGCSELSLVKISDKLVVIDNNAFLSCPKVFLNGTLSASAVVGTGNDRIK